MWKIWTHTFATELLIINLNKTNEHFKIFDDSTGFVIDEKNVFDDHTSVTSRDVFKYVWYAQVRSSKNLGENHKSKTRSRENK